MEYETQHIKLRIERHTEYTKICQDKVYEKKLKSQYIVKHKNIK